MNSDEATMTQNNPRGSDRQAENPLPTSQVESNTNDRNTNNLQIVQIGKVSYHNFLINIFTDSTEKNPRRFFFEPIVLLDLKSISSQTNQLFKQDVVHFTLKMWNKELRSKVLERVQSMPTFKGIAIDEEDICVIPYEEVQLVLNPGSIMDQSVKLMEHPTISFHSSHSSDRLDFYFNCDSRSTADTLAENFRQYPGFVLQKWKLALECRGLVLGNEAKSKLPPVTINVSTLPPQEITDGTTSTVDEVMKEQDSPLLTFVKDPANLCQDMTDWMSSLIDKKKWKNAIPVFSANKCRNPDDLLTPIFRIRARKSTGGRRAPRPPRVEPGLLGFAVIDTASNKHGTFDLANGKFTVKTAGVYLFHFSGYYMTNTYRTIPESASVQLRVNGFPVARSASRVPVTFEAKKSDDEEDDDDDEDKPSHSVTVSSFSRLETGDVVDCFSDQLYLHEEDEPFDEYSDEDEAIKSNNKRITSQFSAFYFSDE